MPRHLAREVEDLQHRRTLSHDPVEFQILQQLFLEHTHAPALIVQLRDIVQRLLQVRPVYGFWQKVCCSATDGFQRGIQRVIAGHQKNVYARVALQGLAQKLVSIHPWHVHIHKRETAAAPLNQLDSLLGICRGDGLVSYACDQGR